MKKYLILFVYTDIIKGDGYRLLNKFIKLKNYQKLKTWMDRGSQPRLPWNPATPALLWRLQWR